MCAHGRVEVILVHCSDRPGRCPFMCPCPCALVAMAMFTPVTIWLANLRKRTSLNLAARGAEERFRHRVLQLDRLVEVVLVVGVDAVGEVARCFG